MDLRKTEDPQRYTPAYAASGWSVFPITLDQKLPFSKKDVRAALPHQRGFKDATTDIETIWAWWTEHLKQWGGPTPTSGGRLLDGRTWDEMPTRGRS